MCGIAGWVDFGRDLTSEQRTVDAMTDTLAKRGPDGRGTWLRTHVALGHRRLAVLDPAGGAQPLVNDEPVCAVTYNGEIYNFREVRAELEALGHRFRTRCDTEVILRAYLEWQSACVHKLNGIFAFAIWDDAREELVLVRDRLGVKPLYYYPLTNGLLFGSEPKAILAHPNARAEVSRDELCDALLFLRTPGRVPLRGMFEVKPGHTVSFGRAGLREQRYWSLAAKAHTDDLATTVATVRRLLEDSVRSQMVSDVPLCALLSGGLDSSAVASMAREARNSTGGPTLETFVVDFVGHTANFRADAIRPSADAPFARAVADHLLTHHHTVLLEPTRLLEPRVRSEVLRAWDLPYNFGDLDVSLYLLFEAVREHATVALSGEAADELFGGYLWFSNPEAIRAQTFPWLMLGAHRGLDPRAVFTGEFVDGLDLAGYQAQRYAEALAEVPVLDGEAPVERRMREISYLTLTRWLPILLEKKDRMSMAVGLEGRVPFCDHRLVEYVFNIPWEMKSAFAIEKGILREAVRDLLPSEVVNRKKAAYPSVQDAEYDRTLVDALCESVHGRRSPLASCLSLRGVERLLERTRTATLSEFERILVESTVRLDTWMSTYNVELIGSRSVS